ncbi:uncharacterized protein ColSpa_10503 [Colletotrichum spaethianum]|uniref:Uncharacterized protein n=1 Tax=Colletotrichum spaethianum TaxID=700344 RepID=A0AA37PDS1_9PEZI|nr:uncharacterized protein ColSpa_10503 [Colletotrichum spaethianum]GKT50322.1 hypothetical protein ColSpa_10503 [Colletotrichum spaethianum]
MPASQIASPLPIPPQRRNLRLMTGQDLYTSLNATLASTTHRPVTPVHMIQENDYSVPAPPPRAQSLSPRNTGSHRSVARPF